MMQKLDEELRLLYSIFHTNPISVGNLLFLVMFTDNAIVKE